MTLDDWILALHLLSAFALVGALTMFWIVMIGLRSTGDPRRVVALEPVAKVAKVAVIAGSVGTVVFGIWLAISLDPYRVWDGWVLAAIVLWAIASETGRRVDVRMEPAMQRARELVAAGSTGSDAEVAAGMRDPVAWRLHTIATVATLLVLLDMIWKPGA